MTKFKTYINEVFDFDTDTDRSFASSELDKMSYNVIMKMIPKISSKCRPFLQAVKSCKNKALWRGVTGSKNIVIYKTIRTDRKPLMSKVKIQKEWDKLFMETYGWKPRSEGLFVTGDIDMTSGYGDNHYIVFPVGPIQYLWSPTIADLFTYWNEPIERKEEIVKNEYRDKLICNALQDGAEIMIKSKGYYGIRSSALVNFLKGSGNGRAEGLSHYNDDKQKAGDIFIEDYLL